MPSVPAAPPAPAPATAAVASILLVGDDPHARMRYRTALEPLGAAIVEAEDGAEALGKALCERPDVVIIETRLNRIDGFALCSTLRAELATQAATIIVVTADALPDDVARATKAGADAVFVKPCALDEVVDAMRDIRVQRRSPPIKSLNGSLRMTGVRQRERFVTRQPPRKPLQLSCPVCTSSLQYDRSHVGGVNDDQPEQWDYFVCGRSCGTFQYRHRTGTTREIREKQGGNRPAPNRRAS